MMICYLVLGNMDTKTLFRITLFIIIILNTNCILDDNINDRISHYENLRGIVYLWPEKRQYKMLKLINNNIDSLRRVRDNRWWNK